MTSTDLCNVRKAARMLNVHPRTITRWCEAGRFPGAFKVDPDLDNSAWLIPLADIERKLSERKNNK